MSLEIIRVESAEKAAAILASEAGARFIGGGTLAVRAVNYGDGSIRKLILPDGLGLGDISVGGDRVTLGAAVTMAKIAADTPARLSQAGGGIDRRTGGARHGDRRRQSLRALPLRRFRGGAAGARRRGRDRVVDRTQDNRPRRAPDKRGRRRGGRRRVPDVPASSRRGLPLRQGRPPQTARRLRAVDRGGAASG